MALSTSPPPSPAGPDLASFRAQLERLLSAGDHDTLVAGVMTLVEQLTAHSQKMELRLELALRQLYRKKSERISPEQLALFLAQLPAAQVALAKAEPADESTPAPEPPPKPKKKRGRQPFPDHLRREVRPISVPDDQRTCTDCGAAKTPMGHQISVVWEYKPAEFFLIEERREICVCKKCQAGVVTAPATPKPIEGGRPGPGLLAQLVTSKYRDGLPIYRQSQIYERSGIRLSPSTLGDWCMAAADLLEPVWKLARKDTLACYLVSLDDTGMPVLDRDHPRGIKRGHIWTYLGDQGRTAFCDYTPDWKGEHPLAVLADFTGKVIQSDGYAGIDAHFRGPDPPRRAGCMDHLRRRFIVALEAGDNRAAIAVALIANLYVVEANARHAGDSLEALHQKRQTWSRPRMNQLHQVVADLRGDVVPKSPLGKALTYAVNQWPTLTVFLDDPRVPLANTHVERQQRRTAIGRKAYLFAGSDDAARRLAILQSFVVLCELAKAPMFEYLRDVLAKLAADWPQSRIAELLPASWMDQRRKQPQGQLPPVATVTSTAS